jgi:hypothetical protein
MPPIMSDGRNYSSWQPESVLNDKIKQLVRTFIHPAYLANKQTQ